MSNHTCCARQRVKRGLWSPEEDEKLVNYVNTHGHGCWSTVPRLAGLQRCGKSCRLRWINYLRPDLKRGNFTSQEAALIIELHRVIGNRWAQIARRLPGRTDNEVKNFWNANIKRKLMAHHRLIASSDPTALAAFARNQNQNMLLLNNKNIIPNNLLLDPITMNNNPITSQLIHQTNYTLSPPSSHLSVNYDSALMPNPSVVDVPPASSNFPPIPPVSCSSNNNNYKSPDPIMDQNYLQNDYQPFHSLVQDDHDLGNIDDQDLDLLDALMPEIRNMAEAIGCEFPVDMAPAGQQEVLVDPTAEVIGSEFPVDSSPVAASEGLQEVVDPTAVAVAVAGNSSFDSGSEPLHPTHIKNIASLMATFAPPGSFPPEPWDVPFPESPSFTVSNWGPQP